MVGYITASIAVYTDLVCPENMFEAQRVSMKTCLFIPDCHIPFVDVRAYSIMLSIATDLAPQEVVILGDYLDFYNVSNHPKDSKIRVSLEEELCQGREHLAELRGLFPQSKITFIEGNHEYRLYRYLQSNAPQLSSFVDFADLIGLKGLGIDFVPYGPHQGYQPFNSFLTARHEPQSGGDNCASASLKKAFGSVIFGHTHRLQEAHGVGIDGREHTAISSGWLGNKNQPVFNFCKSHHQWQQGFTVGHFINGKWFLQTVKIKNGVGVLGGHYYEA